MHRNNKYKACQSETIDTMSEMVLGYMGYCYKTKINVEVRQGLGKGVGWVYALDGHECVTPCFCMTTPCHHACK